MATFEFVRLGVPCTVQTQNKSRLDNYRRDLRRIATGLWDGNTAPVTLPVSVVISYYYLADVLDIDNIIKPILDALNGLVYQDDLQVMKVVSQKIPVSSSALPPMASSLLAAGLRSKDDFLHILVEWK